MKRIASAIVGFVLLGTLATAQASPVDVTYTLSGSAGNWILDFSVTDNLGSTNNLYLFGVLLPTQDKTGSPAGWDPNAVNAYNPSIYGGSNTNYDDLWITSPTGSTVIPPGQTLSGFQARSVSLAMPLAVQWMAVSAATGSGSYLGSGCSFICGAPHTNPGFEGFALQVIPLPAAAWLFGGALGLLGVVRRRKAT